MALLGGSGSKDRPGYTGGTLRFAATRKGIIATVWPKKKGKENNPRVVFQQQRMKAATQTVAILSEVEYRPLATAIQQANAAHAGLGGSAAMRPEDLHTQRLLSPRWILSDTTGQRYYPINIRMIASNWLDWLSPAVGSIATRTPEGWLPTALGAPKSHFVGNVEWDPCGKAPDAYQRGPNEAATSWPTSTQIPS